VRTKDAVI